MKIMPDIKQIARSIVVVTAIVAVVAVGLCSGCASTVAQIDTAAALRVSGQQNLANWKKAIADRSDVHEKGLQELEDLFLSRLLATEGGADAVKELSMYRVKLASLNEAKLIDLTDYALAVENALLMQALNEKMIGIWTRWDNALGKVPGVSQLRILAEAETRTYMETLRNGN